MKECQQRPENCWLPRTRELELTGLFNRVNNTREFLCECKIALLQPTETRTGNQGDPGNYGGTSLLPFLGKIHTGILSGNLRDWLLYHKGLIPCPVGSVKCKRMDIFL